MSPTRVLVIDDHQMFADAIELLLAGEREIQVVGTTPTAEEALELARQECPDVVLMDIDLPGMDGIEATRRLLESCPDAKVVVVTAFQESEVMIRAIEAGACGYVPKTWAADELAETIRRAAAGEIVMPAGDMGRVIARLQDVRQARSDAQGRLGNLTSREIEILQLFADGRSTAEVAAALFISPFTVQSHVKSVLAKLGVHSKLEAVTFALRHGLIRVSPGG